MSLQSGIYEGVVRHRRKTPVEHGFRYRVFMLYLDLDELSHLFSDRWGWSLEGHTPGAFWRRDYFGDPEIPLEEALRAEVADRTGLRPRGPIRMLTNLRYFGYCFNPVTFYYFFDPIGKQVESILAEITNTPWGERFSYLMHRDANEGTDRCQKYSFAKDFHVSPFIDMDVDYRWRFSRPDRRLHVHMDDLKRGERFFDATLSLKRREITSAGLNLMLAKYPWITAKTVAAIYWQAFLLHLKKCPPHSHPRYAEESDAHLRSPA